MQSAPTSLKTQSELSAQQPAPLYAPIPSPHRCHLRSLCGRRHCYLKPIRDNGEFYQVDSKLQKFKPDVLKIGCGLFYGLTNSNSRYRHLVVPSVDADALSAQRKGSDDHNAGTATWSGHTKPHSLFPAGHGLISEQPVGRKLHLVCCVKRSRAEVPKENRTLRKKKKMEILVLYVWKHLPILETIV
uniref:Uncharacterized protein n=1 Tax=Timema poppense TaxID=170557 RepID=A0A7R9DII7_TIMPO|nr:unnamed protein product [Timema poppensis]